MRKLMTSAAALILSASPVFAADLPVAPEPVEYVQICDAYGAGYYFIPGTDTCLRIRGRIRAEYRWNDFGDGPNAWSERYRNSTSTRARGYLRMDSRTQTEFGLLRTYMDLYATVDTPGFDSFSSQNLDNEPVGSFNDIETIMTLDKAFIQFGGMTIGLAQSFYDFWTGYAYGAITTVAYSDRNTWLGGYTFDFGNGFSWSISAEDRTYRQQDYYYGEYLDERFRDVEGYAGQRWPNFVTNFRVDQGWGSAQFMAAIQEVRPLEAAADGKVGYAIGAGVEFNLGFLGNSQFALQGSFGQGALGYINSDWGEVVHDASTVYGDVKSGDGVATGWSIAGGIYTEWTPEWNSALQASYSEADQYRLPDHDQWDVVGKIGWTPVHGFEIGSEIAYRSLHFSDAYLDGVNEAPRDRDLVSILIRVQRDF
ncbi:porin [Flexibacterium corallicola]|uniref:porin n=1 Tax=Flexibacterium corallicola TaxID=3037259 RepID=UPI00286ED4A9|nr:porin [Pseudovibrio sp. M1P-2-3]